MEAPWAKEALESWRARGRPCIRSAGKPPVQKTDVRAPLKSEDVRDRGAATVDAIKVHTKKKAFGSAEFEKKFKLACSTGLWVAVFFLPVVNQQIHDWLFIDVDLPHMLKSPDFESYWPNTVQFMFFTIYFTTGDTVAFAFQGIAGTIMAGVNQVIMGYFFPLGGKCAKVGEPMMSGIRGFCEEYEDPNYGTFQWLVWLDFFVVLFLALACNAPESIKKWLVCWHIFYMMAFMSAGGYVASHAVNITSFLGAALSIFVTLVPTIKNGQLTCSNVVANRLTEHPTELAQKIKEISEASLEFMVNAPEEKDKGQRYSFKATKYQIMQWIETIPGMVSTMQSEHATSWWEGWLFGLMIWKQSSQSGYRWFQMSRSHCGVFVDAFKDNVGGFDDVLYVMKKAVSYEDTALYNSLGREERDEVLLERQALRPALEGLVNSAMTLLADIADDVTDSEQTVVTPEMVKEKFETLRAHYKQLQPVRDGASKARHEHRTNLSVYVFSLLGLGQKVIELAGQVKACVETKKKEDFVKKSVGMMWQEFVNIFGETVTKPDGTTRFRVFLEQFWTDRMKRGFTFRNWFSIGLCYVMGNFLQGNVFTAYNPLMASTLAVLLSHYVGSAFYKNLMRLLGLTLGNALPIILMAFVSLFGESGILEFTAHWIMFFLFTTYFAMMYYTSPEWSYIGCIVAGFGCYSFVGTIDTWSAASFEAGYMKIGQVTAAIFIQIVIDNVETALNGTFPRNIVTENTQKLVWGDSDEIGIIEVYGKFVELAESGSGDFGEIRKALRRMKGLVSEQLAMVAEVGNKTVIVRGPQAPFKTSVFELSLPVLDKLLDEVDVLCLVQDYSDIIQESTQWFDANYRGFHEGFISTMRLSLGALKEIIAQTEEGSIQIDFASEKGRKGDDEEPETKSSQRSIRMDVVKRTIRDALDHALEVERICCESGVILAH